MKPSLTRFFCLLACGLLLGAAPLAEMGGPDVYRPEKVRRYLHKYKYLSVELNQETGIPIPVILAVAGLESDWGNSDLARMANNHFGIKSVDWDGAQYCKTTMEFWDGYLSDYEQCFRKYALIRESYLDFGRFLTQRWYYRPLFQLPADDYEAWAYGLQQCSYASDPAYGEKLIRIISEYRLADL